MDSVCIHCITCLRMPYLTGSIFKHAHCTESFMLSTILQKHSCSLTGIKKLRTKYDINLGVDTPLRHSKRLSFALARIKPYKKKKHDKSFIRQGAMYERDLRAKLCALPCREFIGTTSRQCTYQYSIQTINAQ